uniref:Uncharacterized protein n=1 Tax=Urocitellus parryii TaxID=9999 RepID=A0A8D2HWP7_UROPR
MPAGVAYIHFLRHPMANFVTTAQWLLPFCIKHIVKQTHLLLNGVLEEKQSTAPDFFLDTAHVLGEWMAQVLFLPSNLLPVIWFCVCARVCLFCL